MIKNIKKKVNERYQYFSIVLNVDGGEKIYWPSLSKVSKMEELKFPTPLTLSTFIKNFEGVAQNSNVDKLRVRRFRFEKFTGQLEKGFITIFL